MRGLPYGSELKAVWLQLDPNTWNINLNNMPGFSESDFEYGKKMYEVGYEFLGLDLSSAAVFDKFCEFSLLQPGPVRLIKDLPPAIGFHKAESVGLSLHIELLKQAMDLMTTMADELMSQGWLDLIQELEDNNILPKQAPEESGSSVECEPCLLVTAKSEKAEIGRRLQELYYAKLDQFKSHAEEENTSSTSFDFLSSFRAEFLYLDSESTEASKLGMDWGNINLSNSIETPIQNLGALIKKGMSIPMEKTNPNSNQSDEHLKKTTMAFEAIVSMLQEEAENKGIPSNINTSQLACVTFLLLRRLEKDVDGSDLTDWQAWLSKLKDLELTKLK